MKKEIMPIISVVIITVIIFLLFNVDVKTMWQLLTDGGKCALAIIQIAIKYIWLAVSSWFGLLISLIK